MIIVTQPKVNYIPVEEQANRWIVRWDYKPFMDPVYEELPEDATEEQIQNRQIVEMRDTDFATFAQQIYFEKPTFNQIKEKISEYYNGDAKDFDFTPYNV